MSGRRLIFLVLHCVWWGHQRTYPWAACEWCLAPGDRSMFAPLPRVPADIVHEPVTTYSWPTPPGAVIKPTAIIDPPKPRPMIEA